MNRPPTLIQQARARARAAGVPLYSREGVRLVLPLLEERTFGPDRHPARPPPEVQAPARAA